MRKLIPLFLFMLTLCLLTPVVSAQDSDAKPKYMVWELELSPTQMQKAIKAVKTQNAFLKEQNYPFSNLSQTTSEGYYWYSVPFVNYADIDKIVATSKKLWEDNPEKLKELRKNFEDTYQNIARFILELQPELSVLPENMGEAQSGTKHRVISRFYVKPGKEEAFIEQTKNYLAMRKKHGVEDYFYTFQPEFGPNMNIFYFIDEMGTSPAEHFTLNDKFWEKAGEEGDELWKNVAPLLDKTEHFHTYVHYDISYTPAQ